jgi:choline kinase
MKLVIIVILQSLHLTRKGVISSMSDVVYHPDVALTVVRLIAVTLVMIVVGASVVLVVTHFVFSFS